LAKPISKMTDDEIKSAFPLKYTSGIEVSGDVQSIVRKNDLPVLIEIKNCKITNGDEILFDPSWGTFDLALGTSCISVFAGASDRLNYRYGTIGYIDGTGTQKSNFEEEKKPLYDCYEQVALLRENSVKGKALEKQLSNVYEKLSEFPNDWLLRLEMLELFFVHSVDSELKSNLMSELESISGSNEVTAELISRGKAAFLN